MIPAFSPFDRLPLTITNIRNPFDKLIKESLSIKSKHNKAATLRFKARHKKRKKK